MVDKRNHATNKVVFCSAVHLPCAIALPPSPCFLSLICTPGAVRTTTHEVRSCTCALITGSSGRSSRRRRTMAGMYVVVDPTALAPPTSTPWT